MSTTDVESTVRTALQDLVLRETGVDEFSWALKPSKRLAESGLGLSLNSWWSKLDRLKDNYLPQVDPYTKLPVDDRRLAEKTHDKELEDVVTDILAVLES